MRSLARIGLGGVAIAAFAVVGATRCAYSPDPASGTLHCSVSTHLCPEGYSCNTSTDLCIKNGEDAGVHKDTGGGTPCAGMCNIKIMATLTNGSTSTDGNKLVGHWVYDTGSTQTVSCSDGSNQSSDLAGDYVDVTNSGGSLVGDYFCPWNLTTGPGGSATVIKPGQSCSRNMTTAAMGTTMFTWHGTTFTFTTLDGKTATLASTIAVDYVDDPAKTGCTP